MAFDPGSIGLVVPALLLALLVDAAIANHA